MNSPEWITLLIGCVACALNGAAQPLFTFLLAKIVDYTSFAISGSKLTQRIRSKAFACLLRQEVAYFDRPENSSGAICTRLSSSALAIQEMAGTRLGAICEALSLSFFGIILGCFISWQLTLIVFAPLFILVILTYVDVQVRLWTNQQSNQILERASAVKSSRIASSISGIETFFDLFDRIPTIDNASTEGRELGYETRVGLKGSFLSGGEKQRIAIARVLLRRPKVLLLDEATSAMDSHNQQIIQEALEQAQREDSTRTSLIIAHRLSTIRSCDLICALDGGYIVESGTHTELIQRRGAYYSMLAENNL
ncbi:unnamed protein product [Rotaria sp. Silwood2]|nr:unnamed protein product [Rotaria sp. Silwood2]CAF2976322.1 unnamed protein product [Rotaria sp. Silwood2]CAF4024973.1 unnamed protein product [Rotaria sp. Silwood2]CAF4122530.1 unnamed protein product [Rotaria sp. Silwood2]